MIIYLTAKFKKKVKKLSHDRLLKARLQKQLKLFQKNIYHPSLKLHKLKGKRSEQFAIWIEGDLRALAVKDGEDWIFFDLVTHDEY
jgi:mRNA-degrading endonuclease YafQ of YafQ-DinJ toxin-antitoxin module